MAATGTRTRGGRPATAPAREAEPRHPGLHLVPSPRPGAHRASHRRRGPLRLVICLFVVAVLVVGVGENLLGTQQVRLDNLQQQLTAASQRNANLLLQRAQLTAPAHILQVAEHSLGMIMPTSVSYLKPVSTGPSIGQRASGQANAQH